MKHYPLILSAALILLVNYGKGQVTTTERAGQPDIYTVKAEDKEMNEAIKTARQTLNEFNRAFASHNKNYKHFSLKVRFSTSNGGEHIWLSIISFKENKYSGIVDDVPEGIPNMKMGDTIQIQNENITDWLYLNQKKLIGGYTIRLLRKRMTGPERKKFDSEVGFIIED